MGQQYAHASCQQQTHYKLWVYHLHLGICFLPISHIEGWAQDYSNSNIFLKPLFRGNLDPFVNNANLGAIARMSNST